MIGNKSSTTHKPTCLVGDKPPTDLKVAMATRKPTMNRIKEDILRNQRDLGVPSSANWKPTKPLISKHQKIDVDKPM